MLNQPIFTQKQLNSPITTPIEIHFSRWHIFWRMAFGFFWVLLGGIFSYVIFFLATEKSTFGVFEKVLFSLVFPIIGFFIGIRPGLRMLRMKTPRLILDPEKVDFFDLKGNKTISVNWKDVRQIGYHWYDDGSFASRFEINLEVLKPAGQIETVKLNVKGLNPDKDWIYQKIQNHFKR